MQKSHTRVIRGCRECEILYHVPDVATLGQLGHYVVLHTMDWMDVESGASNYAMPVGAKRQPKFAGPALEPSSSS
jgi:hypothetical protein